VRRIAARSPACHAVGTQPFEACVRAALHCCRASRPAGVRAFVSGYTASRSIATVACPQPAQAASRRASARARAASRPCPPNRRRTRATRSCTAQHSKVKQSNATIRNAKNAKQCSAVQCSAVQCAVLWAESCQQCSVSYGRTSSASCSRRRLHSSGRGHGIAGSP
jgi:hypothetical protein